MTSVLLSQIASSIEGATGLETDANDNVNGYLARIAASMDTLRTGIVGDLIAFEASTVAVFGRNLYRSTETFDLSTGNRLEVDALLWMTGVATAQGIWIGDGTKAVYMVREATSSDFTLGRYSAGDASLGHTITTGVAVGPNRIGLIVQAEAAATKALGSSENRIIPATGLGSTGNLINTAAVRVYALADDITRCSVRARHIAL